MTTITHDISDIEGVDDATAWVFYTPQLRESDGTIITTKKKRKYPVDGVLTVELEPGPAVVIAADGKHYPFTVPEEDDSLWPLIQAEVMIPPATRHQELLAAVDSWLGVNTESILDELLGVELASAADAAVTEAITGVEISIEDAGDYQWQFEVGGVPAGTSFTLPPVTASAIATAGLIARMDVLPTVGRRALIENLVYALMAGGVWDRLDGLYVFAAHDEQAAKLNWIGSGVQDVTAVNGPVWTTDRGFTGDDATTYLDTSTPANTLAKFLSEDASMGVYVRTAANGFNNHAISAGTASFISPNNGSSGGFFAARANSSAGSAINVSDGGNTTGLFAWSRDASNVSLYLDGGPFHTAAVGAGSRSSTTVQFLRNGANYSPHQVQMGFIGAGLTAGQHVSLNTAVVAYLTAIGAN